LSVALNPSIERDQFIFPYFSFTGVIKMPLNPPQAAGLNVDPLFSIPSLPPETINTQISLPQPRSQALSTNPDHPATEA
jgi:hypothetical protein